MDFSTPQKEKKHGFINLKTSILISYIISILSNFFLIIILFTTNHLYKWVGLIFHILIIITSILSLKNIITFNNNNLLKYKSYTNYYSLILLITGSFYVIILIYCFVSKVDMDFIYVYFFCILFFGIFHYIFIDIIKSFIKALEDKPSGNKGITTNLIDKNLKALMVN
jgi:hypothetical protein